MTIDSYTALVRERLGAEMPTLRRNRPFMHGERTVRVRWSRDEPAIVHVLGARSRTPLFDPGDSEFFAGLRTERFGADPLGDPFEFGFRAFFESPEAETATRSPLEPGSERYYQFRSGDTIAVRLSNGGVLRAVAVTAIPRYPSIRLVSAIMWIDAESFGLARVAYRLAKPPGRTLRLLRYNPVEGLSVGTRLQRDYSWGRAALTARIGTARVAPDIDLTLQRNHPGHMMLLSLYRSLRGGGPGDGRGTPGIYASGDAADFHWSHGATIRFLPSIRERAWLSLRLFAEQDADIATEATRNRVGAAIAWTPWWGSLESGSVGGGGRVSVRASEGDNPHVRAVAEGALVIPLSSRLRLGMQAGTARVWGDPAPHDLWRDPAPHDLWRIGGSGHWLRGHANTIPGTRVHMARVDLQRRIRFLGLSVFGDWASAGGDDFYAVGAGLVFMDGLLRLEVARGLGGGREGGPDPVLKLHFRGDAWF